MEQNKNDLIFILTLALGQLKLANKEAGNSVGSLSGSFIDMVQDVSKVKWILEKDATAPLKFEERQEALAICNQSLDRTAAGTVGFQFYDMLSQRIESLSNTLEKLTQLLQQHDGQPSAQEYEALIEDIRSRYTIAKDHTLFESLRAGRNILTAVSDALTQKQEDIELF